MRHRAHGYNGILRQCLPLATLVWLRLLHSASSLGLSPSSAQHSSACRTLLASRDTPTETPTTTVQETTLLFQDFVTSMQQRQEEIITSLESLDGSCAKFTNDTWGIFEDAEHSSLTSNKSGGITRVLQGGDVIEKGACSFTLIQQGALSSERAAAIQSRQDLKEIQAGDTYSAAALSIVLHSRSPLVPTFRSDVRIFFVETASGKSMAWFGGGADLTPYYLDEGDMRSFHQMYFDLCTKHEIPGYSYQSMKKACDEYFYLPARCEHRGTGGIFFDDMTATQESSEFVKGVAGTWLPSWLPIVKKHRHSKYSKQQRQWQLLRRGRYLEFNLLYDRGVKFGLATANPRVEGVMVSAPPLIAWEYKHEIVPGSDEAKLMEILKTPRDWIDE